PFRPPVDRRRPARAARVPRLPEAQPRTRIYALPGGEPLASQLRAALRRSDGRLAGAEEPGCNGPRTPARRRYGRCPKADRTRLPRARPLAPVALLEVAPDRLYLLCRGGACARGVGPDRRGASAVAAAVHDRDLPALDRLCSMGHATKANPGRDR